MVRLIIEIKEEESKSDRKLTISKLNIDSEEHKINATEGEIKGLKYLKDKLGLDGRTEIVNQCRRKLKNYETQEELENLIDRIFRW